MEEKCWYMGCRFYDESKPKYCRQWRFPDEDCLIYDDEVLKGYFINNHKWLAVCDYIERMK